MQNFFIRLDAYMNFCNLNDNKVTVSCGISNGLIGKARKRGSLSQDNISKILNIYQDLDANWLMTGRGEMLMSNINIDVKTLPILNIDNVKSNFRINSLKPNKFVAADLSYADFLLEVNNKINLHKYKNGDLLACKKVDIKDIFFQWNNIFIIDTKLGVWVKKLMKGKDSNHLYILSENPNHDSFEIRVSEINSVAVVLGVVKLE